MNITLCLVEFALEKGHFAALSPKCYMAHDIGKDDKKLGTKGVPHSSDLQMQQFLDKLYDHKSTHVPVRGFRMKNDALVRMTQHKSALSDLYCKLRVADDKISCSPLTVNNEYM